LNLPGKLPSAGQTDTPLNQDVNECTRLLSKNPPRGVAVWSVSPVADCWVERQITLVVLDRREIARGREGGKVRRFSRDEPLTFGEL
jgi:hypothetical protein